MKKIFRGAAILSAFIAIFLCSSAAYAIPDIQLYIPGSTYVYGDPSEWVKESWYTKNSAFELQVIVSAAFGDLNLAIAVPTGEFGNVDVMQKDNLGNTIRSDSYSTSAAPSDFSYGAPIMEYKYNKDGSIKSITTMPSHGVYDTNYAIFNIGKVLAEDLTDDVHEMVDGSADFNGKIFYFDITKTGFSKAHFDAYGDGKSAPFSHDAEDGPLPPTIPEPATMSLLGLGLAGLLRFRRKRT